MLYSSTVTKGGISHVFEKTKAKDLVAFSVHGEVYGRWGGDEINHLLVLPSGPLEGFLQSISDRKVTLLWHNFKKGSRFLLKNNNLKH